MDAGDTKKSFPRCLGIISKEATSKTRHARRSGCSGAYRIRWSTASAGTHGGRHDIHGQGIVIPPLSAWSYFKLVEPGMLCIMSAPPGFTASIVALPVEDMPIPCPGPCSHKFPRVPLPFCSPTSKVRSLDGVARALLCVELKPCMLPVALL